MSSTGRRRLTRHALLRVGAAIARPVPSALVLTMLAPLPLFAQRPDMFDPDFSKAVSAVFTFDHFAGLCAEGKGLSPQDAAEVGTWRVTNKIDLVRARVAELELDAAQNARLNQAHAEVLKKYGTLKLWSCRAALQSTRRPEARLAANAPQLLDALERKNAVASTTDSATSAPAQQSAVDRTANAPSGAAPRAAAPPTAAPPTAAAAAAATPTRPSAPLLESIEAIGFDSRPAVGVGGFITLAIYPIVLFRNGDVLTDVSGLAAAGGVEAHRRAHPDEWTRWRRQGGELQLAKEAGWEAPSFQNTYQRLPDDFRLDGFFRALSGTGNLAIGGTDAVTAWREYRFWRDGRVVRGGGSGGQAAAGNASVVTSSVAPNQRGRYRVEGLRLQITYDDGSVESYVLIADPTDPKTGIWLDGEAFPRRRTP